MKFLNIKILTLLIVLILILNGIFLLTDSNPTRTKFSQELSSIEDLEQLKAYLDTDDEKNASLVISRISSIGSAYKTEILEDLWVGGKTFQTLKHKETYQKPTARLMLAEQLLLLKPNADYSKYIKQYVRDPDVIVQARAVHALASVKDDEAIDLLIKSAHSEEFTIAKVAIDSLFLIEANEPNNEVLAKINELNNTVTDIEVRDYIQKKMQPSERESKEIISSDEFLVEDKIDPYLQSGDYQKAIGILLPYAEKNNIRAQYLIGELYLAVKPPDTAKAVQWFSLAIKADYAPAKTGMAELYLSGRGVEKNIHKAVQLLKESEAQGDEGAKKLLDMAKQKGLWGL